MTAPTFLVVPYPVSANRYWSQFILNGRAMQAPSGEAKKYRRAVAQLAQASGIAKTSGPIELRYVLYPERPQDWATRARKDPNGWQYTVRCIDLDNASKVLIDALKDILFDDDKWIQQFQGTRGIPDERGARVVIAVRPWEPEPVQPTLNLELPVIAKPEPVRTQSTRRLDNFDCAF